MRFFLSCEHGGNVVPEAFADAFAGAAKVLDSHRGWDPGALTLFEHMRSDATDHAAAATVTRLLVELNRSLHSRSLFSEYTVGLEPVVRQQILDHHYHPFRTAFRQAVERAITGGETVLHVSVHTFAPVVNDIVRSTDLGLLYDPSHGRERALARQWKQILTSVLPGLAVRLNHPYRGTADGHVVALRRRFGSAYAGIELELNNVHRQREDILLGVADAYRRLCDLQVFSEGAIGIDVEQRLV